MENKLHEALEKTILFMKDTHNIQYSSVFQKYEGPLLFKITLEGTQQRKIVLELLENGSICVLQTRDVIYSELSILMNKLMEFLA